MNAEAHCDLSLSDAAKPLIWRVFGNAADPRNEKSAYELAGPILSERLPDATAALDIAEVRGWFERSAEWTWIRPDLLEPIARLIVENLDPGFPSLAVWSVSAVDADVVGPLLRSWPESRVDAFTDAAIGALGALRDRGNVLDPTRLGGMSDFNRRTAKISLAAFERTCPLATFMHLEGHGWELVHKALHPSARSLINILVDLLVETRPDRFASLLGQLEHPVLQAKAADRFRCPVPEADGAFPPLRWITPVADDALIALSTLQALHAVNDLTQSRERLDRDDGPQNTSQPQSNPEDEHAECKPESVVRRLLDRAAALPVERFIHWAADVLAHAPQILHSAADGSYPANVRLLEDLCAARVAHVLSENEPRALLDAFRTRFATHARANSFRHVADFAWALRTRPEGQAGAVARVALDEYRRFADRELAERSFYFTWANWIDRQSVRSLGRALALSVDTLEPADWIESQCLRLPLTAWDAEDCMEAFFAADRIAQYNFLIAIHALQPAAELGKVPDPESVLEAADKIWAHCRLSERVRCSGSDIASAAEGAARVAVSLGNADDAWILRQAVAGPGPRALLALAQERGLGPEPEVARTKGHDAFAAEFAIACVTQFKSRPVSALDSLVYWGELWLFLNAAEPAEFTAAKIIDARNRLGRFDRASDILVLKLLALADSQLSVVPEVERDIASRYDALWLTHTPFDEKADRDQVDAYRKLATAPPKP